MVEYPSEPMAPVRGKFPRIAQTAKEAVDVIRSNDNIVVQGVAMTPTLLTGKESGCMYLEYWEKQNKYMGW